LNEPYNTVKAWFQDCRDLHEQIEFQRQKIQSIRDAAEKCTQSLSSLPAGGSSGDKVGFAVERLDTEQRQLRLLEQRKDWMSVEATRRAYCLNGSVRARKQAACICEYYVKNKRQREIAEVVGIKNPNAVSVYIHDGLEALADIWENIQTDR